MAGQHFGYETPEDFEAAVAAEMKAMQYHDNQGREPTIPKKQAEPKPKIVGAPGSRERWEWASQLVGDPSIAQEAIAATLYDRVTGELNDAVRAVHRAEERGEYTHEEYNQLGAAIRHLAAINDPHMYEAFAQALEGTEAEEYLPQAVDFAAYQNENADIDALAAQEQARLDQRQALLQSEYEIAAARHGEQAVQAVDGMVRQAEEAFYGPHVNDDEVRALARTTAEQVHANEKASSTFPLDAAITEELIRIAPPGSSWNDRERAEWEAGMRQTVMDNYRKNLGDPNTAIDRAINSMAEDDERVRTGKGAFQRAVEAELDEHNARMHPPHLDRLREQTVREWEATHDESNRETSWTDALGRESDRRERR